MILYCCNCRETIAWAGTCGEGNEPWCNNCRTVQLKRIPHEKWPLKPGYYLARLTAPHEGTFEGNLWNASDAAWEIVQVNSNVLGWESDPTDDIALSVSVPGIRETQWRECFQWGDFICDLRE